MSASRQALTDNPLPHNLEAERSILGAIILDNAALAAAIDAHIAPKDFFPGWNRLIFEAILKLREAGAPIEEIGLIETMRATGELAAYIGALADGMPRLVNVTHYATIVKEKAQLREIASVTEAIRNRALEGVTKPAELYGDLETIVQLAQQNGNGNGRKKLHPVTFTEIATMNLKPVEYVIDPILPVQGLGMLYSRRGTGKTYVSLEIAICVAIGAERCFTWSVTQARPVLYVDGEMPANRMQERLKALVIGHGMKLPPDPRYLRIITPDLEDRGNSPNISTREGQKMIEDHLQGDELLILDNLSALCRSGKENEGDDWVPVAEWLLKLRQRGISVLFDHHAGKGGDQRGTSRREDLLDCVIAMRSPAEHTAHDGLLCEIHLEKLRNSGASDAIYPFELSMRTLDNGGIMWLQRPLKDVIEQTARKMFDEGMSIRDVAEELHISKRRAHQIKNSLKAPF